MMARGREREFLAWLGPELRRLGADDAATAGMSWRVTTMREAGGVDYRQAEAQTVAWQCEFPSIEAARAWGVDVFASVAARFEERFGPEAMVFTSIFETVEI